MIPMEDTREAWKRAAGFSTSKETIYVEHAKVQEFITHAGKKVLEYGCGGGSDTLSYLRRKCRVWYADVVPENVDATAARCTLAGITREQAHPVKLEASAPIPLAGNVMDVVSSHGVLHHIEDPAPVLAEFYRILHAGGYLYVMLYTEHLWREHEKQIEVLVRAQRCQTREQAFGWCTDGIGVPYARAYTEEEGRALLEAAGFGILNVTTWHKNLFRTYKAVKPGQPPPPPGVQA